MRLKLILVPRPLPSVPLLAVFTVLQVTKLEAGPGNKEARLVTNIKSIYTPYHTLSSSYVNHTKYLRFFPLDRSQLSLLTTAVCALTVLHGENSKCTA